MADSVKPSVYLFVGDDLHAMQANVHEMIAHMGDPGMAEMNTTRLDGARMSESDLPEAVNAFPFLLERRLVIVENPLNGVRGESAQERFLGVLEAIPPSTALVLLMEDEFNYRGELTRFNPSHWLMQWASQHTGLVFIKKFMLPGASEMPNWVMKAAQKLGGQFSRPGAEALAAEIGSNTEQAAREIEKLLTYVNYQRPVDAEDVRELTAPGGEWSVFEMADALGGGDKKRALKVLHHLLDEQDARALFGMVVRQFRLLILAREMLDEGELSFEKVKTVGIKSAGQLNKLVPQARGFDMPRLKAAYHRLLEIDELTKSTPLDPSVALDMFIAEL